MKGNIFGAVLVLGCILAGAAVKEVSKVLALVLILLGILAVFVLLFVNAVKRANRCPGCGCMLYPGVRILREKKDGLIRCPKCEILVRVEDLKDQSRDR